MASQAETNKQVLAQTELDLANAVLVIQEAEAELAKLKSITPITFNITEQDADNVPTSSKVSDAGFGTQFPTNPNKGDMFLHVDILPNKLFKWNGQKWIEIAKSTTDRYAYEEEYIQYITDKIVSGEYDMDNLSKSEQDEVLKRLSYNQKRRL